MLVTRETKGSALTHAEMDNNFKELSGVLGTGVEFVLGLFDGSPVNRVAFVLEGFSPTDGFVDRFYLEYDIGDPYSPQVIRWDSILSVAAGVPLVSSPDEFDTDLTVEDGVYTMVFYALNDSLSNMKVSVFPYYKDIAV